MDKGNVILEIFSRLDSARDRMERDVDRDRECCADINRMCPWLASADMRIGDVPVRLADFDPLRAWAEVLVGELISVCQSLGVALSESQASDVLEWYSERREWIPKRRPAPLDARGDGGA